MISGWYGATLFFPDLRITVRNCTNSGKLTTDSGFILTYNDKCSLILPGGGYNLDRTTLFNTKEVAHFWDQSNKAEELVKF